MYYCYYLAKINLSFNLYVKYIVLIKPILSLQTSIPFVLKYKALQYSWRLNFF